MLTHNGRKRQLLSPEINLDIIGHGRETAKRTPHKELPSRVLGLLVRSSLINVSGWAILFVEHSKNESASRVLNNPWRITKTVFVDGVGADAKNKAGPLTTSFYT